MGTSSLQNGATLTWTKEVLPTGKQNSTEMLLDSKDDSNFADSMMKTNSHMVVQKQKTENDVKKMTLPSLTVKDLFAQDTTKTTQSGNKEINIHYVSMTSFVMTSYSLCIRYIYKFNLPDFFNKASFYISPRFRKVGQCVIL